MLNSWELLNKKSPFEEKFQLDESQRIEQLKASQKNLIEVRDTLVEAEVGKHTFDRLKSEEEITIQEELFNKTLEKISKELTDQTTLRNRNKYLENEIISLTNQIKQQKE